MKGTEMKGEKRRRKFKDKENSIKKETNRKKVGHPRTILMKYPNIALKKSYWVPPPPPSTQMTPGEERLT